MQVEYGILTARNQNSDPDLIAKYRALCAGGQAWRGWQSKFLCAVPNEPGLTRKQRKGEMFYFPYLGSIVDYFVAMLFAAPPQIRTTKATATVDPDPYYGRLADDADSNGTSLPAFLRVRAKEGFSAGLAWARAVLPPVDVLPETEAEYQDAKLGEAWLVPVLAENVLDWELDASGGFAWVLLHHVSCPRPDPTKPRNLITETFTILDKREERLFSITYDPNKLKPTAKTMVDLVDIKKHRFARVPMSCLDLRDLWLVDRLADPAIELFKIDCALNWAMKRALNPVMVFNSDDGTDPAIGEGYVIKIGKDEKLAWTACDPGPFEMILKRRDQMKDEIYRIPSQMAQGVNNNAAAIGRSGESKQTDADATKVLLDAFSDRIVEFAEDLLTLIAGGRGETEIDFSVEGMDVYDPTELAAFLSTALDVQKLNIPSLTAQHEIAFKIIKHILPALSAEKQNLIRAEIESSP